MSNIKDIEPEDFAYFIYNMPTQQAEDYFRKVKATLRDKSNQEVEEVRLQLEEVNRALDQSLERRKKLRKLSSKM